MRRWTDRSRSFQTNPRGVGGSLSPLWLSFPPSFRPTLVGSEDATDQAQIGDANSFRPTLVGSEVLARAGGRRPHMGFQTNPRGVGGSIWTSSATATTRFRPTLVGSEDEAQQPGEVPASVSDQTSWGRRIHGARLRIGEMC